MKGKFENPLLAISLGVATVLVIAVVGLIAYEMGRDSAQRDSLRASSSQKVIPHVDGTTTEKAPQEDGLIETSDLREIAGATPEPAAIEQMQNNVQDTPATIAAEQKNVNATNSVEGIGLSEGDLQLISEVWQIIGSEFDGELPAAEDVIYRAIDGSLELLQDDFTAFVPPEAAQRVRERLNGGFEGIGAIVDLNADGYLLIERPIADQPADLAGIQEGDVITHINGESVLGMTLNEMVAEVRGPKGTDVLLTIERSSLTEPIEVSVTRDLIEFPVVISEMLEDNIAYVRLTSFSDNADEHLVSALEVLLAEEPAGLILDLRDNPGGYRNQAVAVADLFLPEATVLYQRDNEGHEVVFVSDDGDLAESIPLVVIVNIGSASASEIVAGAVQDLERGIVIGETTFGKGSVQQSHTLSNGSELRVTIARWYTPNYESIDKKGIVPDIQVAAPDEIGGENDLQIQRAIEVLLNGT